MRISDKIKGLRESLGLTQTELGEKLGVKKNAVSKWECGRVEDIPMSKVKTMASIFNVPPSYLIDDDIEEIPCRNIFKLSDDEKSVILAYRSADELDRLLVQRTLKIDSNNIKPLSKDVG